MANCENKRRCIAAVLLQRYGKQAASSKQQARQQYWRQNREETKSALLRIFSARRQREEGMDSTMDLRRVTCSLGAELN